MKKQMAISAAVIGAGIATVVILFRKRLFPCVFCKVPKDLPQMMYPDIGHYTGSDCPKSKCWTVKHATFDPEEYRVRGCKNITAPVYKNRWIVSSPDVHILCQPILTDSKSAARNYDLVGGRVGVDLWGWRSGMYPVAKINRLYDEIAKNEQVWNGMCGKQQCTDDPDRFMTEIRNDIAYHGNDCQLGIQNYNK
jgi:hypothetical protein